MRELAAAVGSAVTCQGKIRLSRDITLHPTPEENTRCIYPVRPCLSLLAW